PSPNRFKAAFKAYSMAPAFAIEDLFGLPSGDSRWDKEEREHYLVQHPDQRYGDLANTIVPEGSSDAEKALALTLHLSKNAIYTLSPNHDVKPSDDPVAPFLFGDLRGYCVHFAHAMVYMMRSLGIPARVGTGYLTDLSQAKDGHILLRMSDRHAWAEGYIEGKGWIPFDIQPEQVESHAETPVDMKLLEELMAMIGPGEEILPESILEGESQIEEAFSFYVPTVKDFVVLAATLLILLLLGKLYLRFSWCLPANAQKKLKRSYLAITSTLYDLGYRRSVGETRKEFGERLYAERDLSFLKTTAMLNLSNYSKLGTAALTSREIALGRKADFDTFSAIALSRRCLAALNPASLLGLLTGGRW
ncbi:transglutaminase-like domain-containing protein, partial [Oligoflexia bacterium]|nr:transglutaminase-like domain-containing protein [Oligoflexia bacterium]